MRKWVGILALACVSQFGSSCSSTTSSEPATKPYLEITHSTIVFVVDSMGNARAASDSAMVVSMHDGSKFRLKLGTSDGYSHAFSWRVDDTTEALVHRVIFSSNPSAIASPIKGQLYEADLYPIVTSSTEFLSGLPFSAMMLFK